MSKKNVGHYAWKFLKQGTKIVVSGVIGIGVIIEVICKSFNEKEE